MEVLEISESQGSLQGDACAADPDLLFENGCFTANGVFRNGLSEDMEVLNLHSLFVDDEVYSFWFIFFLPQICILFPSFLC